MGAIGVAVVQMRGRLGEAASNRRATLARCEEAAAKGARLIVLPELVISGYTTDPALLVEAAEPAEGETLAAWTDVAQRTGAFVAGGFCEREGDNLFNSAMLVGPNGLVGLYRKLHLFDAEKRVFAPGDRGLPVFDLPIGRVGLCVCYDLRFVEVLRALSLQGADLVAVPTAWVGGFDAKVFDPMGFIGQARGAVVQANLNQVFLACASQGGQEAGMRFLGSSLVVDPYGEVLSGPMGPDVDETAVVVLDMAEARAAQVRSPLVRPREDRRTDVYGLGLAGRLL